MVLLVVGVVAHGGIAVGVSFTVAVVLVVVVVVVVVGEVPAHRAVQVVVRLISLEQLALASTTIPLLW